MNIVAFVVLIFVRIESRVPKLYLPVSLLAYASDSLWVGTFSVQAVEVVLGPTE